MSGFNIGDSRVIESREVSDGRQMDGVLLRMNAWKSQT